MRDSIEPFLNSLSVNGASPHTIKAYRSDLLGFFQWIETPDPTNPTKPTRPIDLLASQYISVHRVDWKPKTTLRKMATLRAFGKFIDVPLLKDYRGPVAAAGVAHPLPNGMDDVQRMLKAARRPHHQAMVILNSMLGLRISEVLACTIDWFAATNGEVWLTVRGKGDKERILPVSTNLMDMLEPAIQEALSRTDRRLVPLTDRAARRAFTRLGARAGVTRPVASHDGRMTAGSRFYEQSGNDIRVTQDLLGHASTDTTQGYTHVSAEKKKLAAVL